MIDYRTRKKSGYSLIWVVIHNFTIMCVGYHWKTKTLNHLKNSFKTFFVSKNSLAKSNCDRWWNWVLENTFTGFLNHYGFEGYSRKISRGASFDGGFKREIRDLPKVPFYKIKWKLTWWTTHRNLHFAVTTKNIFSTKAAPIDESINPIKIKYFKEKQA